MESIICPADAAQITAPEAQSLRIAGSLARDIEKSNLVGTVVTGPLIRMPSLSNSAVNLSGYQQSKKLSRKKRGACTARVKLLPIRDLRVTGNKSPSTGWRQPVCVAGNAATTDRAAHRIARSGTNSWARNHALS
jgi:hypothetical protein